MLQELAEKLGMAAQALQEGGDPQKAMEQLDKLSDADRELVIEYYSYEAGGKTELRNAMAERLDCTPATLYVRVCRVRKRLKKCREECCKT